MDLAVAGTLRKETIRKREEELYNIRDQIEDEIDTNKQRLDALPSVEEFEWKNQIIRSEIMAYLGSLERLKEMSYEEKRRFLHWLFDGKDDDGVPYGIYIGKNGNDKWDYFIYVRFFSGPWILKGDNIDYLDEDVINSGIRMPGEIGFYKTNSLCQQKVKRKTYSVSSVPLR